MISALKKNYSAEIENHISNGKGSGERGSGYLFSLLPYEEVKLCLDLKEWGKFFLSGKMICIKALTYKEHGMLKQIKYDHYG